MASSELKMDNVERTETLNEQEASCPPLSNITTPLESSQLTPSQLDISPQSFTPSSNVKGNSDIEEVSCLSFHWVHCSLTLSCI